MLADRTWRRRRALSRAEQLTGDQRYIDMGVRLIEVVQDPSGVEVYHGKPRVVRVGEHRAGGMLDTTTMQFVGPSRNPVVIYASPEQSRLIRHGDDLAEAVLVYGAEGAGKTRGVLAPWLLWRALEFTGRPAELGATAPTDKRLSRIIEALHEVMPPEWFTYRSHDRLFTLRNGVSIRCCSTKRYSAEVGSPIQGWSWVAAASDELQDSLDANDDIEMRGRDAPGGYYRRMCSATAKEDPAWYEFRDKLATLASWAIARLSGFTNPFVHPSRWQKLKATLSARAYARRVLAQDVRPVSAVYHSFDREHALRPVPRIGAPDVTAEKLGGYHALLGHDPGQIQDVTLVLKCYREGKGRNAIDRWYVVDEVTTEASTTEAHVIAVRARLQTEWGLQYPGADNPKVMVRCDPQGDTDTKTDHTVYTIWRNASFETRSAAYTARGKPTGRVPKEPGIEMVNRLLCSAAGVRRLFIACDENRQPAAPKLVAALEMSQRDPLGKAEVKVKGKPDYSHWPAALRYALWFLERPRLGEEMEAVG